MKTMVMSASLLILWTASSVPAVENHPKVLNNLVTELQHLDRCNPEAGRTLEFTNPRGGWCYFSVTGEAVDGADRAFDWPGKLAGYTILAAVLIDGRREQIDAIRDFVAGR